MGRARHETGVNPVPAGRAPGRSQAGPHPLGGSADVPVGRGVVMSELKIQGVSRTFEGVRRGASTVALQPTDLAVASNDFITILGPSGCGKSTLLRIVAGL